MISFYCPKCGKHIEVADAYAGKSGGCEGCGERLTVPDTSQPPPYTGLDDLHNLPDQTVAPERIGAYGKAADKNWVDPAATEEERKRRAAEAEVPLPEVPDEILAIVRARRRRNLNYVILAIFAALVIGFFLLPVLLQPVTPDKTKEYKGPATPVERPGAPDFSREGEPPVS
ncbi:MAG: hypothetical protein GC168_09855 [Candidatus Hydrogenedens sp.]|nr:hypothetical protein [Candidatus Hydrogenedens sp.]